MFFRKRTARMAAPSCDPSTVEAGFEGLSINRRALIKGALASSVCGAALLGPGEALAGIALPARVRFDFGVASGDPLADGVIIWTAITPSNPGLHVVGWSVSTTPDMTKVVRRGTTITDAAVDYTVKVDVRGLSPNTTYFFQFIARGQVSPVGRTRTLPTGAVSDLKIAAFTCSDYEWGVFNVYGEAAKADDLNAMLFLGDFIYEYAPGNFATPALRTGLVTQIRAPLLRPATEVVSLADYRLRYRLYRMDKNLQALSAKNPGIHVWDDHEFADNANQFGAINHNPMTQGPFSERKKHAIQAYYEWIPMREPANGAPRFDSQGRPAPIYRSFDFGTLLRLVMLDTRIIGRDKSFESPQEIATPQLFQVYQNPGPLGTFPDDKNPDGTTRSLLGFTQEAWVDQTLASSTQTWQLIGNQVLYRYGIAPDILNSNALTPTLRTSLLGFLDKLFGMGAGQMFGALGAIGAPSPAEQDSWTGYPSAKARFLGSLAKAKNPIIVTGDSHNAWATNIGLPTQKGIVPAAVEFGTTSVTSPGFEQTILVLPADVAAQLVVDSSQRNSKLDKIVYTDQSRRGYIVLDFTPQKVTANFIFVSTVFSPAYTVSTQQITVNAGDKMIKGVVTPLPPPPTPATAGVR